MPNLRVAFRQIESLAPTPERGLPEEVLLLVSRLTPLVNVDLLVQDEAGRTLLTWRHDRFYGPGWHVPGGIIRYKERATDRVRAVAQAELGADVAFEPIPIAMQEYLAPESRERGHFISLLYRCRLLTPLDFSLKFIPDAPQAGHWAWHQGCPDNLIPEQDGYRAFLG